MSNVAFTILVKTSRSPKEMTLMSATTKAITKKPNQM